MRRHLRLVLGALVLWGAASAQQPDASLADRARQLRARLRGASTSDQLGILRERRAVLEQLIAESPATAIESALPPEELATLRARFPQEADLLEESGSWTGQARVTIADYFRERRSETQVRLLNGESSQEVYFAATMPSLECGQDLKVDGLRVGSRIAAATASPGTIRTASGCTTTGVQNVAVILVNLPSNRLPPGATQPFFQNVIFSGSGTSLNGFWKEASYGTTSANGVVVGPVTLDQDYTCSQLDALKVNAIQKVDGLLDFRQYQRLLLILPPISGCPIGLGTIGCEALNSPLHGSFTASVAWMMDTTASNTSGGSDDAANWVSLTAHEAGHGLGLQHESLMDYGNIPLGPPGVSGTYSEYGYFSVMGYSFTYGSTTLTPHYAALHKQILGWLASGSSIQQVQNNGTFVIQPYETAAPGLKALRIQRTGTSWLWLEYRQGIGYDTSLGIASSGIFSGALIHDEDPGLNHPGHALNLDFNPVSAPNDFFQAPMTSGQVWNDPNTSLSIQIGSATSSGLAVTVHYTTPPCPLTLSTPPSTFGTAGGTGTITVTTPAGCPWTVSGVPAWITLTSGASGGSGNGSVGYTITPNAGLPRSATLVVGGQNYAIAQSGISTTMSLSSTSLTVGVTATVATDPQSVTLSFSPTFAAAWTATPSSPNITVNPPSGTGNAVLQISATAGASGTIAISAPGVTNGSQTITVTVNNITNPSVPFGVMDTPGNNATGLSGAFPITGWALDDVEVTGVSIWRDAFPQDAPGAANPGPGPQTGLVYIGPAIFLSGTRPDVKAAFPTYPMNDRGGWGMMFLSNMTLNNNGTSGVGGNGTYRIHAIASDKDGHQTEIAVHTITVDNVHATIPFGTIDTPAQGETISGTQYVNFAWALTQQPKIIPTDASTMFVSIDGANSGRPVYGFPRADIDSLFPGYMNTGKAVGYFYINSTTLANGIHSIAWSVRDSGGNIQGIGSRVFYVQNAGPVPSLLSADAAMTPGPVEVQRGFDFEAPAEPLAVAEDGYSVELRPAARMEVRFHQPAPSACLIDGDTCGPLPAGARLDSNAGVLYWQPDISARGEFRFRVEGVGPLTVRIR